METATTRPTLLFLYSSRCGLSRRADALLAHILQRHSNHRRFTIRKIEVGEQAALAERLRVRETPVVCVVVDRRVVARLDQPLRARQLADFLRPWLDAPAGERVAA